MEEVPRQSKPLAVVFSVLAGGASLAILYNAFLNQPDARQTLLQAQGLSAPGAIAAADKTSRTIVLKYDPLVEDIQRELLAAGLFTGLVDGVTGPKTRIAVESYQKQNQLDITGESSRQLLEHILYTRKLNQAAEFTGSLQPADVVAQKQPSPQPVAKLVAKPAQPVVKKPGAGDSAIAKVQQRLAELGYDPGSRSGQLDEGTRSAILIFEMDRGLPMQGRISKGLLTALKAVEATRVAKPKPAPKPKPKS